MSSPCTPRSFSVKSVHNFLSYGGLLLLLFGWNVYTDTCGYLRTRQSLQYHDMVRTKVSMSLAHITIKEYTGELIIARDHSLIFINDFDTKCFVTRTAWKQYWPLHSDHLKCKWHYKRYDNCCRTGTICHEQCAAQSHRTEVKQMHQVL